jgi:hypothetical protein
VLASPLIYSGQRNREDPELRLAHPSGNSELRYIHLCSSLILLYPDFNFSHIFSLAAPAAYLSLAVWPHTGAAGLALQERQTSGLPQWWVGGRGRPPEVAETRGLRWGGSVVGVRIKSSKTFELVRG